MDDDRVPYSSWRIEPFNINSPYWAGALEVYIRTWQADPRQSLYFFSQQASYPDYRGLAAVAEDQVVGMVFGARCEPGQWWYDHVALRVGTDHPALQDAWVLIELAVSSEWRGRGIGEALHNAVLAAQPCPRALLSTESSNVLARGMYERRGWRYLHPGFAFEPSGAEFVIMHRPLRPGHDGE